MEDLEPTVREIEEAHERIKPFIEDTPIKETSVFVKSHGIQVFNKLENLQKTGAFKVRGAANKFLQMDAKQLKNGVVTASAGNHGQAVAYMSSQIKTKAKIFLPNETPLIKIKRCKDYGAEPIIGGNSFDDARNEAVKYAKENNSTFISPYADRQIIAGQGTIGLEILDYCQPKTIVVPIGGGGLISGIAIAIKSMDPKIKIIGVQAEGAPSMYQSFHQGKLIKSKALHTIADGIAVKAPNVSMLKMIKKWVDDVVTVSEYEIAQAITYALEQGRFLLEGAGAVPLAALLGNKLPNKGATVLVNSGGNLDLNRLGRIIDLGLMAQGRIFRASLQIEDRPGKLMQLAGVMAEQKANILQVIHTRASRSLSLNQIEVELTGETQNLEHFEKVKSALEEKGFRVRAHD